ncbi:hypothetical protein ACFV6E_20015 [Streptomyces sp. NPDC059785]|uniref:hypothetical protein n=1 Tax=unclassified Streptomyces TaxID=2593676 RepID=UPI00364C6295
MGVPDDLAAEAARIDALLRHLAERPVDLSDPDWPARLLEGPEPLDEANVREEAETALERLLDHYGQGDERTRGEVRALLASRPSFRAATALPEARTPDDFRRHLLHLSARDHGADTRDEMMTLQALSDQARAARIDLRPLLLEVAALSSDQDKYGMGSMRTILRRAAGQDPANLP